MTTVDGDAPGRRTVTLTGTSRYAVYYEDTDFSGFVYHANYLKFFERAREDLLGIAAIRDLYGVGLHFVVTRMEIDFVAPARHGDTVRVETVMNLSASPVVAVEQRAMHEGGGPLVAAVIRLAAVGADGRPRRIPAAVLDRFQAGAVAPTPVTTRGTP